VTEEKPCVIVEHASDQDGERAVFTTAVGGALMFEIDWDEARDNCGYCWEAWQEAGTKLDEPHLSRIREQLEAICDHILIRKAELNGPEDEIRASELQVGDRYIEPGDLDVTVVTALDRHGDSVLVTGTTDMHPISITLDADTVVELLQREHA
jgi:hypothetical protein